MRGSVFKILLLAHAVCAITGPRIDNEYDRRRQASQHPGFIEHQTRFGINSPLQNFQQSNLVTTPPTVNIPFQQSNFQQQQTYVPQFNNLIQNQNQIPNNVGIQNNNLPLPNNQQFQFNQQPQNLNQPILQNNFPQNNFQQQNVRHQVPQPNPTVLPQPVPTLPSFQNNAFLNNQNIQFPNPSIQPNTVNIGSQRPTQAAFLPTLSTPQSIPAYTPQSPISIQQAPNLAPQNVDQIPFQNNLGQSPIFSNAQTSQLQSYSEQQQQYKENLEKLKELHERQRIIQKHQEFVQKQQQKQQEKVEKLHEEFLSKQATKTIPPSFSTTETYDEIYKSQERRRPIQSHETELFRKAVELFQKQHPTTSTTTTTTTTTTTPAPPSPRYRSRPKPKPRNPPQDKHKQQLYNEIKTLLEESDTKGFDDNLRAKSVALLQKPDILKQLKVALAENPEDFNEKNFTSREISLNGQKFEVIRTTNPNLIPKGAIAADESGIAQIMAAANKENQKESRISFDDLTKGVLPPGANFELIKQSDNGKLEEVEKIPATLQNKKKVTFVFLEEQDDGSYKVKGVKANGQQTEEGPEVESILNKIKKGEIQLPGPTKISNSIFSSTTSKPISDTTDYVAESSTSHPSSYSSFVTMSSHGATGHTNPIIHSTASPNYRNSFSQSTRISPHTQTFSPSPRIVSSTERYTKSTTPAYVSSSRNTFSQSTRDPFRSTTIINTTPSFPHKELVVIGSSTPSPSFDTSSPHSSFGRQVNPGLVEILKENGLFATAKYLRQSGLDSILNETGPYTFFAPTDKAFRTLLVQLGGPDRAEEKFRDNPRLLSGVCMTVKRKCLSFVKMLNQNGISPFVVQLLLHHVIPGAFDIGSLQDEMTGVSLAGTQLRVNQYEMHDVEWNEVKVTTINGARVLDDKKDIHIPQGIAHAVDRVMFPLPVGDIVQTLQADRDRRFTTFIKAIIASGFAETLAESKTFTVFAPTDSAFSRLPASELSRYSDKAAAKALVARHVLPGTLYSAGMRYYQLRNSMEDAKPLTLQKNSGRIKVNNAQVLTHNIPATNGVIHAIDNIL